MNINLIHLNHTTSVWVLYNLKSTKLNKIHLFEHVCIYRMAHRDLHRAISPVLIEINKVCFF